MHFGTIYPTTAVGVSAKCNLDLLQGIAFALLNIHGPWIIGGDWNCSPEDLAATGWLDLVQGVVVAPTLSSPTCHGKVFDYFVVARCFHHNVVGVKTIANAGYHPHSPVRLFLRGASTIARIRQVASPMRLDARLPFGPFNRAEALTTVELDGADINVAAEAVVRAV